MAAIEKTYTKDWEEYNSLRFWAQGKEFVCPNGRVLRPSEYLYEWNMEDFKGQELPIMHTPQVLDYFLIKYCPLEFVQKRMKEVYRSWYDEVITGESDYDRLEYIDHRPAHYNLGKNLVWVKKPKHNKIPEGTCIEMYDPESDFPCDFDPELKRFLSPDEFSIYTGNQWDVSGMTWKAVMRLLRGMPLPEGASFVVSDMEGYKYKFFAL